ncbi:MAG: SDR family NAD(P)-dependent oxidoreductase [Solirubrobacterales bacterium]|nr:SDR family NAD(P)-dependent oxidoreductase [Solirubrobacterales bacterium]
MAYVAVVTGASSGIGEATARRLAREPGVTLVLVARRRERLEALARELGRATVVAVDLTSDDAPAVVRDAVQRDHGELHLLVNNAGASWRGSLAEAGSANVLRHIAANFEAPVRLTETLLPLLRRTAAAGGGDGRVGATDPRGRRIAVVNVCSTGARVSRPGAGAYSASKAALAAWTDALALEELPHAVHVGLVMPGFVPTEGFPATELRQRALTRWALSSPERVAEAILEAGPGGRAERYVPRPYWLAAASRILLPGIVRRLTAGGAFTTATGEDRPQVRGPSA